MKMCLPFLCFVIILDASYSTNKYINSGVLSLQKVKSYMYVGVSYGVGVSNKIPSITCRDLKRVFDDGKAIAHLVLSGQSNIETQNFFAKLDEWCIKLNNISCDKMLGYFSQKYADGNSLVDL
jgi:hypothetical protein